MKADERVLAHTMAWFVELVPKRLCVGPFPGGRTDALYLRDVVGVTHVLNMCPATERTVRERPASRWYECHWERKTDDVPPGPEVLDAALPADMDALSDAKKLAYFAECVSRVHAVLSLSLIHI